MLFHVGKAGSTHFNPRSREGSDTIRSHFPSFRCHFNPRSREGSDTKCELTMQLSGISIHAPARGATE